MLGSVLYTIVIVKLRGKHDWGFSSTLFTCIIYLKDSLDIMRSCIKFLLKKDNKFREKEEIMLSPLPWSSNLYLFISAIGLWSFNLPIHQWSVIHYTYILSIDSKCNKPTNQAGLMVAACWFDVLSASFLFNIQHRYPSIKTLTS